MPIVIACPAFVSNFGTTFFFSSLWTPFSLTKVGPPIFEWAVPRPFVHLRVEIMVLLSMISDWICVRINLNAYSNSLSHFCFKVQHYIIFVSSLWTTFSLTKVGPPIFEWAVPRLIVHPWVEIMVLLSVISAWVFVRINFNAYSDRLFVHPWVEIMVLLSMISAWIFVRINLNAYSFSLRRAVVQSSAL